MRKSGFSLIQILISLGILGLGSFAMLQLVSGQRSVLLNNQTMREKKSPELITNILSSPVTCTKAFEGRRIVRGVNDQFDSSIELQLGPEMSVREGSAWMNLGTVHKISVTSRSRLSSPSPGIDRYDATLRVLGRESGSNVTAEWLSTPIVLDLNSQGGVVGCQTKMESQSVTRAQCQISGGQSTGLVGIANDGSPECQQLSDDRVTNLSCPQGQILTGIDRGQPLCVPIPVGSGELIASLSREYSCQWKNGQARYSGQGVITESEFVDGSSIFRNDGLLNNPFIEVDVPSEASHLIMVLRFESQRLPIPTSSIFSRFESFYWQGSVDLGRYSSFLDLRIGRQNNEPRNFTPQRGTGESGVLFRGGVMADGTQMQARANPTQQNTPGGSDDLGWYGTEAFIPSNQNFWSGRFVHHLRASDQKMAFQGWSKCYGLPSNFNDLPNRVKFELHFCSGINPNPNHLCFGT